MALPYALAALLLFAPQQDSLADGVKALDANQPAVAEPLLREAVRKDPDNFTAHFNLALALSLEQKDDEAIQELRRTLQLKPGLYQADVNLGTLLLRTNKPAEALPVLKEAAELRPTEGHPNLLYAQALLQTNDLAQADRFFHDAAAIDARYKDELLSLAAAYEKAKMIPQAVAIYKEFPDNSAARDRIARLQAAGSDSAAAIPDLELAVKQSPTVANRLALADAYKLNKQPGKVLEQLQLAASSEPGNYDVRMDLGRELRDRRQFVAAATQFSAAAKIRPDSVKAWNELAAVLIVSEDYAAGLAALDHVRALGQEGPGDYFYRAISLEKLKQPQPALEAYRRFLASDAGKMPDQEFQARQRIRIIENELRH